MIRTIGALAATVLTIVMVTIVAFVCASSVLVLMFEAPIAGLVVFLLLVLFTITRKKEG